MILFKSKSVRGWCNVPDAKCYETTYLRSAIILDESARRPQAAHTRVAER